MVRISEVHTCKEEWEQHFEFDRDVLSCPDLLHVAPRSVDHVLRYFFKHVLLLIYRKITFDILKLNIAVKNNTDMIS